MVHPNMAPHLAALPKATATSLGKLLSDPKRTSKKLSAAFVKALQEAGYPCSTSTFVGKLTDLTDARSRGVMPLPSELTPAQRALVELLAYEDDAQLYYHDGQWQLFSLPETATNRRRWLGLEAQGVLDEPMDYQIDGVTRSVPVWHALQRAALKDRRLKAFFDELPMVRRLELFSACFPAAYGLEFIAQGPSYYLDFGALKSEGGPWATACAERLAPLPARSLRSSPEIRVVMFQALARAGLPVDPRWDRLFPLLGRTERLAEMRECLSAIPVERRESALLAAMGDDTLFDTMSGVLALLDDVPSKRLTLALLERTDATGLPAMLTALDAFGERHAEIREALADYRAKKSKRVIALVCGPAVKPLSVDALNAAQQKQLRAFGRAYDGDDLPATARLAPGKDPESGSFSGFLELIPIVDAKTHKTVYDAYLTVDSGSIFKTGTTTQVAAITQGGLEQCKDPALYAALGKALESRPRS